ncbi:hypothetical protein J3F83DRAFT_747564 [Trichoderma novae-zelandiae]
MAVPEDPETGAFDPSTLVSGERPALEPISGADAKELKLQAAEDIEEITTTDAEASSNFTGHQLFYIFGVHGIGALIISGGINFAIAYAMYTTQNTDTKPIRLWQLPNTLAGDAAVTMIIQCIITWFVELFILRFDLGQRSVQPIGFIARPTNPLLRFFFFLPRDATTEAQNKPRPWSLIEVIQQALRGFSFAVVSFLLLWPIFVGALTAFGDKEGGDYYYHRKWLPQIFKLILGGVLGLLTTPWMAMFWLVKAGWEERKDVAVIAEV